MRQCECEILVQYFYNRIEYMDNEMFELKNAIRFRNITESDMLEMIIVQSNRVLLRQINNDIFNLLKIWEKGGADNEKNT